MILLDIFLLLLLVIVTMVVGGYGVFTLIRTLSEGFFPLGSKIQVLTEGKLVEYTVIAFYDGRIFGEDNFGYTKRIYKEDIACKESLTDYFTRRFIDD